MPSAYHNNVSRASRHYVVFATLLDGLLKYDKLRSLHRTLDFLSLRWMPNLFLQLWLSKSPPSLWPAKSPGWVSASTLGCNRTGLDGCSSSIESGWGVSMGGSSSSSCRPARALRSTSDITGDGIPLPGTQDGSPWLSYRGKKLELDEFFFVYHNRQQF